MMRPGANGSAASLSSTNIKRQNNGNETQSEVMVIGADQELFEPRSSPRSRRKIAATSTNAPRKSIRRNLVFQSEEFCLGSFRTRATLRKAAAHTGPCARKALGDVSLHPKRKQGRHTIANWFGPPTDRLLRVSILPPLEEANPYRVVRHNQPLRHRWCWESLARFLSLEAVQYHSSWSKQPWSCLHHRYLQRPERIIQPHRSPILNCLSYSCNNEFVHIPR